MLDIDHRILGDSLKLFHFEQDSPGVVFWHPRGYALWNAIESFLRKKLVQSGYDEVRSPQILSKKLWEQSGHWELFKENMFILHEDQDNPLALKPMNCPAHIKIFKHGVHSWRDLPIRLAEFGQVHRDEPSGALHGLLRLRGFIQDDAHIFCRPDQVEKEVVDFCNLLAEIYQIFGFSKPKAYISLRPERRKGSDEVWERAEAMLASAAKAAGLEPEPQPGEGAFYGPKLEFALKDRQGREWQCGVIQLDLIMPELFNAKYRDNEDQHQLPVLLHRAILGSIERFIGILLEHWEGKLPFWLQPEQVEIFPVLPLHEKMAKDIEVKLLDNGIRSAICRGDGNIGNRMKKAMRVGVPAIIVIGEKEAAGDYYSLKIDGDIQELSQDGLLEFLSNKNKY